jgi:hypothetical protein
MHINGNTLRADSPIALADLVQRMPTVAQREAHESRSNRFRAVTTADVLEDLNAHGFDIYGAQRVGAKGAHAGFEKHMITLRHRDFRADVIKQLQPGVHKFIEDGEVIPEIRLRNANDGTSSYELFAAMFKVACCNGLMVGYSFGALRVAHTGDVVAKVRNSAANIIDLFRPMLEQKEAMKLRAMSEADISEFTHKAAALRFDSESDMPFRHDRLAAARRAEDSAPNLWNVFNRVQENLITGGQRGVIVGENGRARRTRTRSVQAIDASVKINRGLWDLAVDYVDETPKPLTPALYEAA